MMYKTTSKELEMSIELDTNIFLEDVCDINCDLNDCCKLIRNLKISDIQKTMIDPEEKKCWMFQSCK